MRVLETDPSISYKMGKNRKHRIRKAKENEAEESSEDGTGCPHVAKAVNLAAMRKVIQKSTVTLGECIGCSKDGAKSTSKDLFGGIIEGPVPAETEDAETLETTICVCLQCGHQGCDRHSANKHALKHYKTPHSGIHSIIINLTTWSAWCYLCDEEVPPNPRLQSCIEFLQKESGVSKPDSAQLPGRPLDSPAAEAASPLANTPASKLSGSSSCVKVKGLSNLGNTCFFNAVMQSLCQTKALESLLLERSKQGRLCTIPGPEPSLDSDSCSSDDDREEDVSDKFKTLKKALLSKQTLSHGFHMMLNALRCLFLKPPIQSNFGEPGPVTLALLSFVQEMRGGTTRNGTVNPTALFTQVCKKAPRFKGFQQQDSHELLRYLIDCIRTEEIKRGQASILKFFKLPETVNPKKVDEETKHKVKEYGRQVKHTFLDGLFGGQLVSTVKCEECKAVSQIFEAFLDLSLPVMEEKPQRPNLILIGKKKDSISLNDIGDDGEAAAAASAMGLDTGVEKPNRYQEKKNKRQAKKEAKRKAKLNKSKSSELPDSAGKGDHEERPNHEQDAGSEDSNKNDIEHDSGSVDKETQDDGKKKSEATSNVSSAGVDDGSQTRRDLAQTLSGRSSRTEDSSPDGSKEGLDNDEDEEKDDPSDADVEDNIESDMSRLDLSMMASGASLPHPTATVKQDLSHSGSNTVEQSSDQVPLEGMSYSVTTEVSSTTYPDQDQNSLDKSSQNIPEASQNGCTVTCSFQLPKEDSPKAEDMPQNHVESAGNTVSAHGTFQILTNGNVNGVTSTPCDKKDTHEIDQVSSGIQELKVTEADTVEDTSISCEVEVNNSQVIQLSNGIGTLTVCDNGDDADDNNVQSVIINGCEAVAMISTEVSTEQSMNVSDVKPNDSENEVNATFSLTLPNDIEKGGNQEGSSVQSEHRLGDNEGGDAEVQISLTDDKQNALQNVLKTRQEFLKEARNYSMSTLAPRYHPAPKECSILSCLNQFTAAELLTGSNKFGCKECTKRRRKNSHSHKAEKKGKETVYSNANKQYLIFRPPAVLTLHLKRFEQTGLTSRKVNRHVDFPLVLDLAPYCSSLCLGVKEGQTKVLYALYGVVEHSGRLSGGHYTAYIKVRPGLGSHTQFLYNQASGAMDLLNAYLARVVKSKESSPVWQEGSGDKSEGGDVMDKDIEARAEALVPPGRWFHISDSRVNEVAESEVLKAQAYLLFYERIF